MTSNPRKGSSHQDRKWAIEQAVLAGVTDLVAEARRILAFVEGTREAEPSKGPLEKQLAHLAKMRAGHWKKKGARPAELIKHSERTTYYG